MSFWSSLVVSQSMATESGDRATLLASPELQAALRRFVGACAGFRVDDLVQATLTDALASQSAPDQKTSSSAGSTALPGTKLPITSDAIAGSAGGPAAGGGGRRGKRAAQRPRAAQVGGAGAAQRRRRREHARMDAARRSG